MTTGRVNNNEQRVPQDTSLKLIGERNAAENSSQDPNKRYNPYVV